MLKKTKKCKKSNSGPKKLDSAMNEVIKIMFNNSIRFIVCLFIVFLYHCSWLNDSGVFVTKTQRKRWVLGKSPLGTSIQEFNYLLYNSKITTGTVEQNVTTSISLIIFFTINPYSNLTYHYKNLFKWIKMHLSD